MPSSDQIDCTSRPSDSRSRAPTAIAHGACTRAPNGVRMQTRQSPISSRKRSTTTVRSDGDRAGRPLLLAEEGERGSARRARRGPGTFGSLAASSSRANFPIASPSSYGRPTPSPFQNGTAPGTPGAGETSTRSRVISSIRQEEAPSTITWPARAS